MAGDNPVVSKSMMVTLREVAARVKCYFDVWRDRPPRFGGPPVPLDGDSRASWDEE